jgi:hypothetical protein
MKPIRVLGGLSFTCAVLTSVSGLAMAGSSGPAMLGKGYPFQIENLPLKSRLRQSLEALTPTAKAKAMAHLHSFSFPLADTALLMADPEGGIFYSDTYTPKPTASSSSSSSSASTSFPAVNVFQLHSNPGATRKVFLDFDGQIISGTAWNSSVAGYAAVAFDTDSPPNPTYFSAAEQNIIQEVWHRIAEDFAPFNIDVTTEDPLDYGSNVIGRILFTKDTDAGGLQMPAYGAGGVAYVGVWGSSNYGSYYSPALVYYNNLGPSYPPYMAEAGSHEFGHNLGLSHDGIKPAGTNPYCSGTTAYYCGLGSGLVSWAPIMGAGYYLNVTEWSKGEYPYANNTQDDLAIISSHLTYRNDDIGNSMASAAPLLVEADGSILVTTPQNDPANVDPNNKGVIETNTDSDFFYFDAGTGTINLTVTPAWAAFTRTGSVGDGRSANLDIRITLYDQNGAQLASSDPSNDTSATISTSLSAGRYYLAVNGVGNAITPYSTYNSMGEYFISGSLPTSSATSDTTPPEPNPMAWATAPTAQSSSIITMTAATANDASGIVQYQFQCVAGGTGCANSNWQSSTSYAASGLTAGTAYTFQVVARDAAGNTTASSATASATTQAAITVPSAPSNLNATALRGRKITLNWTDASNNETSFIVQRSTNGGTSWSWSTTLSANTQSFTNSGLQIGTTYTYRVGASNSAGTNYSNTATAKATK